MESSPSMKKLWEGAKGDAKSAAKLCVEYSTTDGGIRPMNSMDCFNQKETLTWALDRPPAGWKQGWILNHLALFFSPTGRRFFNAVCREARPRIETRRDTWVSVKDPVPRGICV